MKSKNDTFKRCIGDIERVIGYVFSDKSLITQAFTRTSFCNEANQRGEAYQSNEVLEFVGDSVLSLSIITFLMKNHAERYERGIKTRLNEGDFSNIKSKLSDKKNLSECITSLGLQKYLRLGEGDKKLGIENEPSVKEDLFESIIGAVYLDSDMDVSAIMRVVSKMLDLSVYAVKEPPVQSSKNALQEFCADKKRRLTQPIYRTLSEDGPDHKKIYERGVYIGERLVASARGKNLKLADAAAADAALKALISEEGGKAEKGREEPQLTGKGATSSASTKSKSAKKRPNKATDDKREQKSTPSRSAKNSNHASKGENASNTGNMQTIVSTSETAPNNKGTVKGVTRGTSSASVKLKNHAAKHSVATPTFKDLGESLEGGRRVYRVECIFMDKKAVGTGETRPLARENAATAILCSLAPKDSKRKERK